MKYVTFIDVDQAAAQNIQELASIWGKIDNELEDIGVEVEDAYAVLGEIDFLIIFSAPNDDTAFQADLILERHGLDVRTMEITPTEHFATLVDDL